MKRSDHCFESKNSGSKKSVTSDEDRSTAMMFLSTKRVNADVTGICCPMKCVCVGYAGNDLNNTKLDKSKSHSPLADKRTGSNVKFCALCRLAIGKKITAHLLRCPDALSLSVDATSHTIPPRILMVQCRIN